MSRPAQHPSGPAQVVTIRLSPHHVGKLDELAQAQNLSRSQLVARLLDRVTIKRTP